MKEPNEAEIRRATAHAAMYFIISLLLAFFAVYIPITLSIGLRVLFVLMPILLGWLSFFAPPRILVFVMKWLP